MSIDKKKALKDQELIAKYEAGKINLGAKVEKMLKQPNKASVKSEKQSTKKDR